MSKQAQTVFLEEWLRSSTGNNSSSSNNKSSGNSSAQTIIQAWAELRDCLQKSVFLDSHLNSLKALVNFQASLYVADPQAKLVLAILSSPNISLPYDSYPLLFRLLYIWVRKSSKPSLALIDSAVEIFAHHFDHLFDHHHHHNHATKSKLFAEAALLVGALSFVRGVSRNTKAVCLQLLCRMLEDKRSSIGSVGGLGLITDVLSGIGYALSSSEQIYFVRLLDFLLGDWVKIKEESHDISHALIVLHLIEWVMFGFINAGSSEKIRVFSIEVMESHKTNYAMFAVLMATSGALRALNRLVKQSERLDNVSRLRVSAEALIEAVATDLISKIGPYNGVITEDSEVSFLLHCLSLAMARCGGIISTRGPLLVCLALALLNEVFPLRRLNAKILGGPAGKFENMISDVVKKHRDSIIFKEAGATTGVFCSLYVSANEEDKLKVEDLVWAFCHDVYLGHRQVALLLQGRSDYLLSDLEKIAESAFLMAVVFALAVTKHRLTSTFSREVQMDASVKILVSFSCLEYFRRIRLPEYMETIRGAVASVQEDESAFVSFVECLPSYADLTAPQGWPSSQNMKYLWFKDEVQTARILFYLRVIPTAISRLPSTVFQEVVAATMFLYPGNHSLHYS